jgi:hypothetical protein
VAEREEKKQRRPEPRGDESPAGVDEVVDEPAWGDEGGAGAYDGGPTTQKDAAIPGRKK